MGKELKRMGFVIIIVVIVSLVFYFYYMVEGRCCPVKL